MTGRADEIGRQSARLNDGAQRVAAGNRQLADNVPTLVGAIGQASDGADQLQSGTSQLATGAREAAGGADRLASGASRLTDGTDQLSDGAGALRDGALRLQDGLTDGSEQVPDYTKDQREKLAKTAATPVTDAADRLNAVASYGEGLAPYFMALALWVGAMSIYLLLRPVSARAIASTTSAVRTALAGFVPGAALSVVQAVLLVGVLLGIVGVDASQPGLLLGLAGQRRLVDLGRHVDALGAGVARRDRLVAGVERALVGTRGQRCCADPGHHEGDGTRGSRRETQAGLATAGTDSRPTAADGVARRLLPDVESTFGRR